MQLNCSVKNMQNNIWHTVHNWYYTYIPPGIVFPVQQVGFDCDVFPPWGLQGKIWVIISSPCIFSLQYTKLPYNSAIFIYRCVWLLLKLRAYNCTLSIISPPLLFAKIVCVGIFISNLSPPYTALWVLLIQKSTANDGNTLIFVFSSHHNSVDMKGLRNEVDKSTFCMMTGHTSIVFKLWP